MIRIVTILFLAILLLNSKFNISYAKEKNQPTTKDSKSKSDSSSPEKSTIASINNSISNDSFSRESIAALSSFSEVANIMAIKSDTTQQRQMEEQERQINSIQPSKNQKKQHQHKPQKGQEEHKPKKKKKKYFLIRHLMMMGLLKRCPMILKILLVVILNLL